MLIVETSTMATIYASLRNKMTSMNSCLITLCLSHALLNVSNAESPNRRIGINYGTLGNNLLSPCQSIELIKSMKAGYVKIYDTNAETLKHLSNTNLLVSIMTPNEQIPQIGTDENIARRWVQDNVLPYFPQTKIRYIMVGNEVLSNENQAQWDSLVPAMRLIKKILRAYGIHNIKVGTPLGMDFLNQSFPPSNASFRSDALTTLIPLLEFLNASKSNLFLDVYPYFPWSADPTAVGLDFALLDGDPNLGYRDPFTGLVYTNLLDQMIDSVYFAMSKLGFPEIGITISETGWPNDGDDDEPGANVQNAEIYTRNLIRKIMADPPIGTPARPGTVFTTFLFALFDEDLKSGRGSERHWGLLRPDGTPVFQFDFSGSTALPSHRVKLN